MTIAFGSSHVVFIENPGGLIEFNEEKEIIRKRHLEENEQLFKPNSFVWQKNINPALFENLIKDSSWLKKLNVLNKGCL
jgi:hypothetical protein